MWGGGRETGRMNILMVVQIYCLDIKKGRKITRTFN